MSQYGVDGSGELVMDADTRTKQSMRDECDINLIMSRFTKTGLLTHLASGVPRFADVSDMSDYASAIENVRLVEEYFAGLPSAVRSEFKNDAAGFMAYLESGASEEDLRKLGLKVVGDRRERKRKDREGDGPLDPPPPVVVAPPEPPGTVPT